MMRYFSMFTGVGGFELGIERANGLRWLQQDNVKGEGGSENNQKERGDDNGRKFTCVGFSEIDKYASQLLANKWPNIKNYGNARNINPTELPDFDMLCGGFPCQAFSLAGKRRGFEDTRGTLFFEIARILEVKRPKIVFLENVKGLLNHNKGETFKVIIQTLSELGYDVQWMVLNSKFFGVPQNRERVFIIGSLRGTPRPEILPFRCGYREVDKGEEQISNTITSGYYKLGRHIQTIREPELNLIYELKGDTPSGISRQGDRIWGQDGISPTLTSQLGDLTVPKILAYPLKFLDRNQKNLQGEYSFTIDSTNTGGIAILDLYNKTEHSDRSPTLTEPHHNNLRVREGTKIRRLTPIECERLQGFPDNWTSGFSDTQRYKMMGNVVTVNVIKAIAEKLCDK